MKAFNDWARFPHDQEEWNRGYAIGAKDSWRAAIEWAENQFINQSSFGAEEAINKELRD